MTIHLPAESALALAMAMTDPHTTMLLRRHAAEQAVEDLINFLDDTEGDCDLEENGDERDCSWASSGMPSDKHLAQTEDDEPSDGGCGAYHGNKMLYDLELDTVDAEPTLGSPEQMHGGDQEHWSQGSTRDADGEEVNEDGGTFTDEPHDAADEGNDEHSLCYHFGKGGADGDHDGPMGWKTERDRPAASLMAAKAMRMACAKAVA